MIGCLKSRWPCHAERADYFPTDLLEPRWFWRKRVERVDSLLQGVFDMLCVKWLHEIRNDIRPQRHPRLEIANTGRDDDEGVWIRRSKSIDQPETIGPWHTDIDECDIGMRPLQRRKHRDTVRRGVDGEAMGGNHPRE